MVSHAVNLNALVIVDVKVFRLSYGKHGVVLQEADVVYPLFGIELYDKILLLPV